MKISFKWLKQFIQTNKAPEEISLILTNIGLEVESLEKVQAIPGGLDGLLIGHVRECIQHPNADRLKVAKVDIGNEQILQIVCGANNVAVGQKVVIAPVNVMIYPVSREPFKITNSKIRGEVSEGMICAEDEIGLGPTHDGILILDENAVIGSPVKEYYKIEDDYLFEIGLTPNRADAASHLGVARDLAAYLKTSVQLPEVSSFKVDQADLNIKVNIEDTSACPRYSSLTISGITVKDSPDWLKQKLNVIGIRPINNIVDATNYVLHDLGQPLHAFNVEAITGAKVFVKKCADGTLFQTLDGIERKLSAEDLMICDDNGPMCMAGIFGGMHSGINWDTRNIFLESAWFNSVSIRKTSKRHGLKTDASFRFERGTDPEMTVFALKRAALLIQEIAGGLISSHIFDHYPDPASPFKVDLIFNNVDRLIGKKIDHGQIKFILIGLGINICSENETGLQLEVPAYKVDVTREVDVVEEILRIYGYNNIEIPKQIRASLNIPVKPDKEVLQNQVADFLSANGFFEMLSNSLSKSSCLSDPAKAVKILNPLSTDLDVMRQSLLYSGLEAISYNQNRRKANLKLYEFGKIYHADRHRFVENQRMAIFMTGNLYAENWAAASHNLSFYNLKSIIDRLIVRLDIRGLSVTDTASDLFTFGLQYLKGDKSIVNFGSVSKTALNKFDIQTEVFYADFDWDTVFKSIGNNKIAFQEISRFPSVRRDISMLLNKNVTFEQLKQIAVKTEKKLLKEVNVFDVYEGDKLPGGKKSYALSFVFQDAEKTLADKQIENTIQKLIYSFEKEAGAEIRR